MYNTTYNYYEIVKFGKTVGKSIYNVRILSSHVLSDGPSHIWLYASGTGECLSLSVRMRNARTLDLTILHFRVLFPNY